MKVCLVLQNQYAKLGHALAMTLKKTHGADSFCAYVFSPGAATFIRSQSDIRYEPLLVDHELHAKFEAEKIDRNYIADFERIYAPPHLWHYFYSDRKLMMSIGPKEETTTVIDPLYGHDDLLKILQNRARAIEEMLKASRPDCIIFFAIGALSHLILFHVAKKLGIRTFNIDFPRVGNLISISEDYRTLSGVEQIFHDIKKNHAAVPEQAKAEALIEKFRTTGSLDIEYLAVDLAVNPSHSNKLRPKSLTALVSFIATLFGNYWRNRGLYLYGMADQNPLRFIGQKLKQRYRKWRGIADLYAEPAVNEEYALYPLHYEPELATLLLSPFYFDQMALIRHIARSLPLHMKLYVKEHPAMVYRRSRSFYKELLKIPNVKLVSHKIRSFELIQNAKLVTVITGTVGWEACLLGKPVISFGEVFFNALSFVKRVRNIETLPQVVIDQLHRFAYDEKEMRDFVAATIKDSFAFNFAGLWFENDLQKLLADPGIHAFCENLMKKFRQPPYRSDFHIDYATGSGSLANVQRT